MKKVHYWLLASRPKTLPAAISPVLVGCGISIGLSDFHLLPALAALLVAVMIQIGANLVNDVADFQRGTDTDERLGPMRVTQSGLLSEKEVWIASAIVFFIAGLAGLYLAIVVGPIVLLIGVSSIVAAILYTFGPYPLAYIGLGDLFVMIFFGFVAVCGTVFVIVEYVPSVVWFSAIAVGALTTNILVVNNIRDLETDKKAGRINIPVLFGRVGGEIEYLLMLVIAYLIPIVVFLFFGLSIFVLLPLISSPLAVVLYINLINTKESQTYNLLLAKTAQLLLIYSILFAIGLAFL